MDGRSVFVLGVEDVQIALVEYVVKHYPHKLGTQDKTSVVTIDGAPLSTSFENVVIEITLGKG